MKNRKKVEGNINEREENIKDNVYKKVTDFIYETGIHSKTPRSGLWFLGSGKQSVAEHLFHTAMITYAICYFEPNADKNKAVMMALFHDIGEGRTSDLNYVHQRYGRLAEANAVSDISSTVPFGKEIISLYTEEQGKETLEAKLVKDADQLEWISKLREEEIKGNKKATKWIKIAYDRLKTETGKKFGKMLISTNPDNWWFNENDKWFVDRKKEDNNSKEQN